VTKKKSISIKLTRRGAFAVRTLADGKAKKTRVAPRIQLRAIGTRPVDGTHLVEIRFQPEKGKMRSVYLEMSYLLPQKKNQLKERLADLGYAWPLNKDEADAIWYALAETRPKRNLSGLVLPVGTVIVLHCQKDFLVPTQMPFRFLLTPNQRHM
jgi:hypothetical protein